MGGMTGSLLLLLWAGVSVSTMVDLQKRIINGQNCGDHERLYHVKLIRGGNEQIFCGGSLINDKWILTAAHCWNETITAEISYRPGPDRLNVPINPNDIHKHDSADIMLLKIPKPKTGFYETAIPDCKKNFLPKNVMVQIAGHASTTAAPDGRRIIGEEKHLQCADIEAIPCPWPNRKPYKKLFCGKTTDTTNPVGACLGDSGGGVVHDGKIFGVISEVKVRACTGPDTYVGVCGYKKWIEHTMKHN